MEKKKILDVLVEHLREGYEQAYEGWDVITDTVCLDGPESDNVFYGLSKIKKIIRHLKNIAFLETVPEEFQRAKKDEEDDEEDAEEEEQEEEEQEEQEEEEEEQEEEKEDEEDPPNKKIKLN